MAAAEQSRQLGGRHQAEADHHGVDWSAETPAALRAKIRAALIAGTLPCISGRVWAGATRAEGHVCVGCGLAIDARDLEYEPRDHLGFFAHIGCFNLWADESALMQKGDAAADTSAAGS